MKKPFADNDLIEYYAANARAGINKYPKGTSARVVRRIRFLAFLCNLVRHA